jgi:hypothetical protein
VSSYRDLLDQFNHEVDRGLDAQRHVAGSYGLAVSVASAAAIALVAQGLGDSKDPTWFRIACLGDVAFSLLITVAVIRSLHLYDLDPAKPESTRRSSPDSLTCLGEIPLRYAVRRSSGHRARSSTPP